MWVGGQSLISPESSFLFSNEVVHSLQQFAFEKSWHKVSVRHKFSIYVFALCRQTTGGMQDMIEDVKELFLLQSSRPYNMMSERERERERESFCASIGLVSHLPPDISVDIWQNQYIPYLTQNKIYHPFHDLTLFFFFFLFPYPLFALPGSYLYSWGLPLPKVWSLFWSKSLVLKGVQAKIII